tara:strand:- start:147 stop:458 length:312 start_codon:yes stop_codon:yes gene_type:complete
MKKFKKKFSFDDQNNFQDSSSDYVCDIKKEIKEIKQFKSNPDLYFKIFIIEIIKEWIEFYNFVIKKYTKGNNKIDVNIIMFLVSNLNNLKLILILINNLELGE